MAEGPMKQQMQMLTEYLALNTSHQSQPPSQPTASRTPVHELTDLQKFVTRQSLDDNRSKQQHNSKQQF